MGNNQHMNPWTEQDIRILKATWRFKVNDKTIMKALFPIRTWTSITSTAHKLGLKRDTRQWNRKSRLNFSGSLNHHWNPNPTDKVVGNKRAIRLYSCPKGKDRHHIDGNPFNNAPENIMFVTRKEHQLLDGRMIQRDSRGLLLPKKEWK
jgi:hypothetical protein